MGAPDPFKKREQSQEPTREELINFLTSSHYVRAVTIEAAKKFIDSKYGQVPWVSHMLGRLKFEYVQDSSFLGVFDPEKNALLIPEHSLYFDEKSLDPKLKKEYKGLAFGNVAEYSTALLLAIYHSVVKSRQKVESPETKKKILGALDHELGHAILHQIKNGLSDFGVSYAEIENYTIGRMRGKTDFLWDCQALSFVGGATISSIRVMQTLAKVFFGTVPTPRRYMKRKRDI